jgi:hypothetical protein
VTAGQVHDSTQAIDLIEGLEVNAVLADKGYDAQEIVQAIESSGGIAIIPSRNNAIQPRIIDAELYIALYFYNFTCVKLIKVCSAIFFKEYSAHLAL